jgi:ribosomal protein S18 acetylase RimI-like enzyme
MFVIRKITANDKETVTQLITEDWGSSIIVSKGKVHDVSSLPGFVAESDEKIAGLITYNVQGNECEITSLSSYTQNKGIGSRLVEAVIKIARENNCYRIWLITTNDNTKAIRFYQKRGFTITAIHIDAIRKSREIKPQIPLFGFDDIPILHEIEFEQRL